jgi:hypothetical protein
MASSIASGLSFLSTKDRYCHLRQANTDFPRGVLCGVARTLPTLGATTQDKPEDPLDILGRLIWSNSNETLLY